MQDIRKPVQSSSQIARLDWRKKPRQMIRKKLYLISLRDHLHQKNVSRISLIKVLGELLQITFNSFFNYIQF